MAPNPQRLETRVVHAGDPHPRIEGAVTLPIFQSTVFEQEEGVGYHELRYPRLNNLPNHEALAAKLADLEGGEAAVVTASGMAAISTTLLTVLGGGGHLLVQDSLYGGTHNLLTDDLDALGMSYDFIDARNRGLLGVEPPDRKPSRVRGGALEPAAPGRGPCRDRPLRHTSTIWSRSSTAPSRRRSTSERSSSASTLCCTAAPST